MEFLAIIMPMIGISSAAKGMVVAIKEQCAKCKTIAEIGNRCIDFLRKISDLLKTLEDEARVVYVARGISTALKQRLEEYRLIRKKLQKMEQVTKPKNAIAHTKRFIKAQDWEKRIEAIRLELADLRNGVERIVLSYFAAMNERKPGPTESSEATENEELMSESHREEDETMECRTVTLRDRTQTTAGKLNNASQTGLFQHGSLDRLFEVSLSAHSTNRKRRIESLERSAKLLDPEANFTLGRYYKRGYGVEKNIDKAFHHFYVAASCGHNYIAIWLINHYEEVNDRRNLLKSIEAASTISLRWRYWSLYVKYAIMYGFNGNQKVQPMIGASQYDSAFSQSLCYFFGVGARKDNLKAMKALREFDSASYRLSGDLPRNQLDIEVRHLAGCYAELFSSLREYLNFLFKVNQILPFLTLSYGTNVYSLEEWEDYARVLANNRSADAHVFLAVHYHSRNNLGNEWKVKRHLRKAADAGHSEAQSICRQLSGGK